MRQYFCDMANLGDAFIGAGICVLVFAVLMAIVLGAGTLVKTLASEREL